MFSIEKNKMSTTSKEQKTSLGNIGIDGHVFVRRWEKVLTYMCVFGGKDIYISIYIYICVCVFTVLM